MCEPRSHARTSARPHVSKLPPFALARPRPIAFSVSRLGSLVLSIAYSLARLLIP